MWTVFAVELRCLLNLFRRDEGRRKLIEASITIVCIAAGSLLVGRQIFHSAPVLEAVSQDTSGVVLRMLLAASLLPPAILALSVALQEARRRLFEPGPAELLLVSPLPPLAQILAVYLRLLLSTGLYGTALAAPALFDFLGRIGHARGAVLAVPFAVLCLIAPLVAVVMSVQIVAMRWLASPRVKGVLSVVGALSSITFALLCAVGFLAPGKAGEALAGLSGSDFAMPFWLEAPAALLALGGAEVSRSEIVVAALLLVSGLVLLALSAPLYRRAYENSTVAAGSWPRGLLRSLGRSWPKNIERSVAKREIVRIVQQPASLVGYLFIGLMIVLIASGAFGSASARSEATPESLADASAVFGPWYLVILMLSILVVTSLGLEGSAEHTLLAASPASRPALLRGKLLTMLPPYGWCLFVAVVAGAWLQGAGGAGLLVFLLVALPLHAIILGVVLAFGILIITEPTGRGSSRSSAWRLCSSVFGVSAVQIAILIGLHELQAEVERSYHGHGMFGGLAEPLVLILVVSSIWAGSIAAGAIGYGLAVRRYRRILG